MYNDKNFCFADFEFTCGYSVKRFNSELLSVGVVICDSQYTIKEKFYCTCRPYRFPKMTSQCLRLTHLKQREIDNSPDSNDVMLTVLNLLKKYNTDSIFVWGNFDKPGLVSDMRQHSRFKKACGNIRKVSERIVDIQKSMTEKMQLPEAVNIKELATVFDYQPVSGTFHNALNDALALCVIYKAVNTENLDENKKLEEIRRERTERKNRSRLKSEQKRKETAFSLPLSEEEKIYYDSIKGNAELELIYIIIRSKFVSAMQSNPDEREFMLIFRNDTRKHKRIKVIPQSKYNRNLQCVTDRTVTFERENFSDIILKECRKKEVITV